MPPDYAALAAQADSFSSQARALAVAAIIDDLDRPSPSNLEQALHALKLLGRCQHGSESLASERSLKVLVRHASILSSNGTTIYDTPIFSRSASKIADLLAPALEALRILANTLLLHQLARSRLCNISGVPKGFVKCLGRSLPQSVHFLVARILFLMTAMGDDIVVHLVDSYNIGLVLGECFTSFLPIAAKQQPDSSSKELLDTLSELLKLLFNITLWYPRLLALSSSIQQNQQYLSPEDIPTPSSRPSSPLQNYTSNSDARKEKSSTAVKSLFSRASELVMGASGRDNSSNGDSDKDDSPHRRTNTKPRAKAAKDSASPQSPPPDGPEVLFDKGFETVVKSLVQLFLSLQLPAIPAPIPPLSKVIECLLNFPFTRNMAPLVYSSLPEYAPTLPYIPTASPNRSAPAVAPIAARLLVLLDSTTRYFLGVSEDFDAWDVRNKEKQTDIHLDSTISSIVLLLRKCCVEHNAGTLRGAIKDCLLPDDIDRSKPLEKRTDLTGRLLRIMSSIYLSRSKDSIGELIFTLCNQDPKEMSLTIGYGNASGFLQAANMLIPPPSGEDEDDIHPNFSPSSTHATPPVDPITGAYAKKKTPSPMDDMTEEEKEIEAERLYTLFERLRRTGVETKNPVHEARRTGKIHELTEQEQEEVRKQEEEKEQEELDDALKEMQLYRDRMGRSSA